MFFYNTHQITIAICTTSSQITLIKRDERFKYSNMNNHTTKNKLEL